MLTFRNDTRCLIINYILGYIYTYSHNLAKYLGANINHKNNVHNDINLRKSAINRGYHAMNKMFTSKLLLRDTKKKLYIDYLRPIIM